jgi:molecular chaperone GrpE (heat shock protein)
MPKEDNKKAIVDFALKELEKVMDDLKAGKIPTLSKDLLKLKDKLNAATKKIEEKPLTPEEEEKMAEELAKGLKVEKKQ